jgi:hypothetical protein
VAGRPIAIQQAGCAEQQRTGANAHDPSGSPPARGEKVQDLRIIEEADEARSARHHDHVQVTTIPERGGRREPPTQFGGNRVRVLPQQLELDSWHAGQEIRGCDVVGGSDIWKNQHADLHGNLPCCERRYPNSIIPNDVRNDKVPTKAAI